MKKILFIATVVLCLMLICNSFAATYTLPEKMQKQLSIGSGLKGSFIIRATGSKFNTPFIDQITDAEFHIRGITSGGDLHYSLFQQNESGQQSAVNELYRKDGIYYFRSDMVQGKILAFPTLSQYLDALFPLHNENTSSSSFVSKLISMSENEKKEKLNPILNRYQKELEMWLAEFTIQADTVKLENGLSALDFTYNIPMNKVFEKIINLYGEFTSDQELISFLDTVMTAEEKSLYFNNNLLYYYQDSLNSIDLSRSILMTKRVSAMGELLRFYLEFPLDERITQFHTLSIEMIDQLTVYTLRSSDKTICVAIPESSVFSAPSYNQSIWLACIHADGSSDNASESFAYRADIERNNEAYNDDSESSHETNQYHIVLQKDTKYLPEECDLNTLSETDDILIDIALHYSSKYAQNSATIVEVSASVSTGDSSLNIEGKFKTATPWIFMPFEVIDPIQTGAEIPSVIEPYMTDWISNAPSIIHHLSPEDETEIGTIEESSANKSNDSSSVEKEVQSNEDTSASDD